MQRILILIFATILLTGCGSNDEPKEEMRQEEVVGKSEVKEDDSVEDSIVELEEGTAHFLSYFGTEESYQDLSGGGEGFIFTDFDGFHVESQFLLADFKPNEEYTYEYNDKETVRAILVFMQAENTTDKDIDYNGTMRIVTDTKEQVHPDFGILSSNGVVQTYYGQVEALGYYIIPLKDDSEPESIDVQMEAPYEVVDGSVDPIDGKIGEDVRFELKAYKD